MPIPAHHAETLPYWYQALAEERGLIIDVDDRVLLRQHLYNSRADASDEDLKQLVILFPPDAENELWIIKRDAS